MTPSRPTSVLYGLLRWSGDLVFGEETHLRALHEEVMAVKSCTTYRQAVDIAARLQLTYVPGLPDDLEELFELGLTLDDPYDASESGPACDGDWPPMVGALSLEVFQPDDEEAWRLLRTSAGAERGTRTFNGDYLAIGRNREDDFLDVLRKLGVRALRDDAVIEDLCSA